MKLSTEPQTRHSQQRSLKVCWTGRFAPYTTSPAWPHIYDYWKELGFREYELNPKHEKRTYMRHDGMCVGVAPETDEKGRELLNKAVEVADHLYSVDSDGSIFEFRWSYSNKYHGFKRDDITKDLLRNIKVKYNG